MLCNYRRLCSDLSVLPLKSIQRGVHLHNGTRRRSLDTRLGIWDIWMVLTLGAGSLTLAFNVFSATA